MRIPYVIDNRTHKMADVLNSILADHKGKALDVATAYFNVRGFRLVQSGLAVLGSFRMLLGDEPEDPAAVGLIPKAPKVVRTLFGELNAAPYTEGTLRAVEDLIAFLRKPDVQVRVFERGFLHAKCYLFYGDHPKRGVDRLQPVAAIVGSSNFTGPGLTTNNELNLAHRAILSPEDVREALELFPRVGMALSDGEKPLVALNERTVEERQTWMGAVGAQAISDLDRWFAAQWEASRDFKAELIELLDASKFGQKEYTPYEVFVKAIFEYFRDDLDAEQVAGIRSAVDLAEFQDDAVKKARSVLARYDGVLVTDSVGLGKTWIGMKLLEDTAYHMRQKALVICPASLRDMWDQNLKEKAIAATILSQEELGQATFDGGPFGDADLLLIDESHNFRNPNAQRFENLERLIALNGGRGRDGARKRLILLTATPINNDLMDLYHQISLITLGDRSYFAAAGIGDLRRFFLNARREAREGTDSQPLFNLLEEVVIRRTRPFIRRAYPNATIQGNPIRWPDRRLSTVRYDLEAVYGGIYEDIVAGIEGLRLAPYHLEAFKKAGVPRDEFEEGREQALVGIFKSRYLKRFESSVHAFRISVRRALEFLKTFESYVLDGKLLDSATFHRAIRLLSNEDEEDDATPISRAGELDATQEARDLLVALPPLDPTDYDLRRLHEAIQADVETLSVIWDRIRGITPGHDAKLDRLKTLLATELKGRKALVFTYYKDTARYLYQELTAERGADFREAAGRPVIRRMDSGASPTERLGLIQAFAPKANMRPELAGSEREIDVLISTDVLSEGQNLQDCGVLVNYDLHWNPMRMVQRAGRIDRIGPEYEVLWVYNMFPDAGLERLLGLVESLNAKIADIDRAGFLDASVLGETVHPRNFNTLRRIRDEDGSVIEEQEEFTELASNEFLVQMLMSLLAAEGRAKLEAIPDGIHSGLARARCRGLFFYFTALSPRGKGREHFWRYYDLGTNRILDNRYVIANLIRCQPDTPRIIGTADVFAIQDRVIEDVLRSSREQQASDAAPKILDPIQQTVATLLRNYLNKPEVDRKEARALIQFLGDPMPGAHLKAVKAAYQAFSRSQDVRALMEALEDLRRVSASPAHADPPTRRELRREDLHLVCFDYVWS